MQPAWHGLRNSDWRRLLRGRSLEWHLRRENYMKRQLGSFWTKWNFSGLLDANPEIKGICSSRIQVRFGNFRGIQVQVEQLGEQIDHEFGGVNLDIKPGIATALSLSERARFRWGVSCLCINTYVLVKTLAIWGVCLQTQCGGCSDSSGEGTTPCNMGYRVSEGVPR